MRKRIQALVVVLIVVIGGGLVVAAVPRLKQAAACAECGNNLRQIGLAVHNYKSCYDFFPQASIPTKDLSPEKRLSWLVNMVPYVDQIGFCMDQTKAWDAEENLEPTFFSNAIEDRKTVSRPVGEWKLLRCPSNPAVAGPGSPGLTHFVGIAGVGVDAASRLEGYPGIGFFGHDRKTRMEDIKDGTAMTMMLIETTWNNGPWTAGGEPTVRGLDVDGVPYLGDGGQFSSNHRRGDLFSLSPPRVTNVLFADASLRPMTSAIKPEVFEALATIAGGEKVGEAGDW